MDALTSLLVVTSNSTGNNVFCTPAIRFLRKHLPDTIIDVVATSSLSAEVFEDNPHINHAYVLRDGRKFDAIAGHYSKVIALNHNGLRKLGEIHTTVELVPEFRQDMHIAEQLLQFVAGWLKKEVREDDRRHTLSSRHPLDTALQARLDAAGDGPVAVIHLGCGTTLLHGWKFFYSRRAADKKLWSIEAYTALGQQLATGLPGVRIVLTGTRNESFLARQFEKAVPGSLNFAGKTTVADLNRLMDQANVFIAHDCGVLHIASASGVPIVALFGPTSLTMTGPYPPGRPHHHIIRKETMGEILPAEVAAEALHILKSPPVPGH